jgi:glucan-binding YG repeat protein
MMRMRITDTLDGNRYYLDPETGAMAAGWVQIDGNWCYFESSGAYVENMVR